MNGGVSQVTLGGVRLSYAEEGRGAPLVFLHGFPFDHTMWSAQVARFAPRWRVVTPDLRGHGGSTARPGGVDEYAADVLALLDMLGVGRFVLCGLSMGGYVAFAVRRRAPHRVAGLVLSDTRAESDSPEEAERRLAVAADVAARGPIAVVEASLDRLLSPVTRRERPAVVDAVRAMMMRTPVEGIVAALHALRTRPDSRPDLPHIACPTLAIAGGDDAITPPETARAMASAIPGAALTVISRAGHLAPMEEPEAWNDAVDDFLTARLGAFAAR